MGIKGSTYKAAEEKRIREREQRLAEQRALEQQARREKEDRIEIERYRRLKALAEREADLFVVVVEGLVYGTSADDVQVRLIEF